jgi:hypothetical protein
VFITGDTYNITNNNSIYTTGTDPAQTDTIRARQGFSEPNPPRDEAVQRDLATALGPDRMPIGNLLPKWSGLISSIEPSVRERLQRSGLAARAADYYSNGNYALGYCCSILGASLNYVVPLAAGADNKGSIVPHPRKYWVKADDAAFFCATALVNLRPLNRWDHAFHLMDKIVHPLLKTDGHEIESVTRARLTMEIGSYFRDAAEPQEARMWSALARYTLRGLNQSTRIKTLLARLWQHDGIAAIIEGKLPCAEYCFKKAEDLITTDYAIGRPNAKLYKTQIMLRSSRPDFQQVLELAKQVLELAKKYPENAPASLVTRWTNLELRLVKVEAEFQRGGRKSRSNAFEMIPRRILQINHELIIPTGATFAPSIRAFRKEYPSEKAKIDSLIRKPTPGFRAIAEIIRPVLTQLSNS